VDYATVDARRAASSSPCQSAATVKAWKCHPPQNLLPD
jgi:hypothetical protein